VTRTRSVTTRDGVALHVAEAGDGARSMLLCNGLYCTTQYYGPWIEQFSRDHRVVSFDYRGHGKSADPTHPGAVTLSTLVDDTLAVLDTLPEPTIVVGHSMGVRVALEVAARAPERVSGVVLLCGPVFGIGDGLIAGAIDRLAPPLLRAFARTSRVSTFVRDSVMHPDWLIGVGSLFGGLARTTPRAPIEALVRNVRRLDVRLMASVGRSYIEHTARPLLPRVSAPTLQIIGGLDQLATRAHARTVERELSRCTTYVAEGCTHLAPIEAPEELHGVVRRFLATLDAS
jgi:pimeloyl-ACP methyl ester carboxylesterase